MFIKPSEIPCTIHSLLIFPKRNNLNISKYFSYQLASLIQAWNTRLTCKTYERLKFEFHQCWIGKKITSTLDNFLNNFFLKKKMVIIFGFLGKSTLEKCIKTLKIDRQSNRIDPEHVLNYITFHLFIQKGSTTIIPPDYSNIRNHPREKKKKKKNRDCNFKILDTCNSFNMRLWESIYICKKKPSLNGQNSST